MLAAVAFLRRFDVETERLVTSYETATQKEMNKLEDDIRKSMKGLGFNVYIFPEGQNLSEVYAEGYASKTMPEAYATKLAESKIMVVNHLLPSLTRKLKWKEQKDRTVLMIGIRGEVPLSHRVKGQKKALINPVAKGKAVLGHELHRGLNLAVGQTFVLHGRKFEVQACNKERGNVDDITIWVDLDEAQEMLGLAGQINAILALECNCFSLDRLGELRREIHKTLPGTQVIEKQSKALARAEARVAAKATAKKRMQELKDNRQALKVKRELSAGVVTVITLVLSMAWVFYLILTNVRERTQEIGILMAIGVLPRKILAAFLGKAVIIGLAGALLGIALLALMGLCPLSFGKGHKLFFELLSVQEVLVAIAVTPLLTCIAAWLPALVAAQKDPAVTLRAD
ncbi:hypothetical protein BVY04_02445 [bacterium M21]|nr:hypothetical protein BVY04_02445 [bacterium M21]